MAARQSNLSALIWCSVPVDTQAVGKLIIRSWKFDVIAVTVMCKVWRLFPHVSRVALLVRGQYP